jgi:hypothetical protein
MMTDNRASVTQLISIPFRSDAVNSLHLLSYRLYPGLARARVSSILDLLIDKYRGMSAGTKEFMQLPLIRVRKILFPLE